MDSSYPWSTSWWILGLEGTLTSPPDDTRQEG